MNIKDYLHFYIGQTVKCTDEESYSDYEYYGMKSKITPFLLDKFSNGKWKPVLRLMRNMTEEEEKEYNQRKQRKGLMYRIHANNTVWLLSRGFDLFGLIDAGLAIDKTTLNHD